MSRIPIEINIQIMKEKRKVNIINKKRKNGEKNILMIKVQTLKKKKVINQILRKVKKEKKNQKKKTKR